MIHRNDGQITWFQFELLSAHENIVTHGVFSRRGGVSTGTFASLNAGPATADDPAARAENYRRIRATLPGHPLLVGTCPLQGTVVREVTVDDLGSREPPACILPEGCDAFITRERGIGLFWAVADCSVIMLIDRVHKAIGLTHAGWRGTCGAILRNTLQAMEDRYGTQPTDLLATISPSIGPCCYEVDDRIRKEFDRDPLVRGTAQFSSLMVPSEDGGERQSLRLDLAESNHAQLLALGVPRERIEVSGLCPGSHTDTFFSHRIEHGQTGRFAVVLGLL